MSIPPEAFVLPPATRGSLQQRIRQMVTEGVLAGRFRAGQKMPSSRGLAEHLGISRITVTLAYAELVSSDYLTARGRSGYFVSESAPRAPEVPLRAPRVESGEFQRLIAGRFQGLAQIDRPADWEGYAHNFIYGQTDPSLFDHQNWRLCAVRALGRKDFAALTQDYYDRDDPLLIEHVLRTILPRRGIDAHPSEVLLTLGAQNGLWLAAQVLLRPGQSVALENPCYPAFRGMVAQTGARIMAVDVDADGLPPEALPERAAASLTAHAPCALLPTALPLIVRLPLPSRASRRICDALPGCWSRFASMALRSRFSNTCLRRRRSARTTRPCNGSTASMMLRVPFSQLAVRLFSTLSSTLATSPSRTGALLR